MTRDEIIRMAREANLGTALSHDGGEQRIWIEGMDWHDEVERFAALVAAAERAQCIKLCEAQLAECDYAEAAGAHACCEAIRARGQV